MKPSHVALAILYTLIAWSLQPEMSWKWFVVTTAQVTFLFWLAYFTGKILRKKLDKI